MLLDQRRTGIMQLVEEKGFVSLHELVGKLGASESTLRRDLEFLDGIGQIRRTRGGAAYTGESITPFEERSVTASLQKQQLGRCVADLIQTGETILLDGGTTTLEVARCLAGKPLQIVTNSLPIANLLVNQPQTELILIGGYLYPRTGVALGPVALAAIGQLHVSRLVLSAGGITEKGLYNSNSLLVDCEKQMLQVADEVWLVADSSKFGKSALVHLCTLSAVTRVFVDDGISSDWLKFLEQAGVTVTVAGPASR